MPRALNFLYFFIIWNFFEINCISAAPNNRVFTKKFKHFGDLFFIPETEECVYLRRINFDIIDNNNPLIEGLNRGNSSWYRQVNWSQEPRDYLIVKYTISRKDLTWHSISSNEIFLCASKPGTEAGEMAELIRETLGMRERCPINLGLSPTDPDLLDGKKCRPMNLTMKLDPKEYIIFFEVKGEGLPHQLMNGFITMSKEPSEL